MEKITVYTTGCPLCRALETILKQKKVEYTTVTDVDFMISKGMHHVPIVEITKENNETIQMNFKEAMSYFGGLK